MWVLVVGCVCKGCNVVGCIPGMASGVIVWCMLCAALSLTRCATVTAHRRAPRVA